MILNRYCCLKQLFLFVLVIQCFTGCNGNLLCYQCTTDEAHCEPHIYCGMHCEDHVLLKSRSFVRPLHCSHLDKYCVKETFNNGTNRFVNRYCAIEAKDNTCEDNVCYRSCKDDGCNGLNNTSSLLIHLSGTLLVLLVGFYLL